MLFVSIAGQRVGVRARRSSKCAAVLAALTIALVNAPAFAEGGPEVEAKERYGRGIDLYGQGDYGGALAEFKRAYDLAPYSVILFNLGLTYAALGRPVEAADAMQKVLEKPGSLSAERVAKAKATEREQSARIAELVVETSAPGAHVEIDGLEVATTPAKPIRLKGGPHRVGVVLSGFAPSRKEIDVAAGAHEKIRFELVATDKRLAHLDVKTNVPGATVLVDGAAIGTSPLASTVSVLPGSHEVSAKRGGYRVASRHVDVGEESTGEVRLELEEDANELRDQGGDIRLAVSETSPVVIVDGKPQSGADVTIRLAPGPHHLKIERAGFFAVERDIEVPSRQSLDVRVNLEPTADTRAAYVKKNESLRTFGLVGIIGGAVIGGAGGTIAGVYLSKKQAAADDITGLKTKKVDGVACGSMGGGEQQVSVCNQFLSNYTSNFDRARTLTFVGWATVGVGAAVLGTGIVLRVVADDPRRYDHKHDETLGSLTPTFAIGPGGGSIGVRGVF